MKKTILNFLFLALSVSVFAQDDIQTFDSFKKLEAATNVEVELIQSNENKAEIWVEKGDIEELKLEQFGSRLKIRWTDRAKLWRGDNYNRKAKIKLYYKELTGVSVSAGAKVTGRDMIKADDFEIDASSGGHMNLEIKANTIDADVSSGGWAEIDGSTRRLVVDASSGGSFKGQDLEASDVKARASSGGNAKVWATDSLEASSSSGGNVRYRGNPTDKDISSSKWSGGSVRSM